jgi:tRNA-dihydrouridine synthase A
MENQNNQTKMGKVNVKEKISPHRVSIAPMLDITNHHFRTFMRLITKEAMLYTEMINHDAILFGNAKEILEFDPSQSPLVVQLGGNKIESLERAAKICAEYNYDEINLNCGCPSSKVQNGHFGACLMKNPEHVAECCARIKEISGLPVSVKCRLGLDTYKEEFLDNFISTVSQKGQVDHFIMHARLAIMKLDTNKNRTIPPLQYSTVFEFKEKYKNLEITLNGGIKTLDDLEILLSNDLKGCMIGRAAYENPWILSDVDRRFFSQPNPAINRKQVFLSYADYCDEQQNKSKKIFPNELIKPLTHLFAGEKKNSNYKNLLNSYKPSETSIKDHLVNLILEYEKINPEALNKLTIDKI